MQMHYVSQKANSFQRTADINCFDSVYTFERSKLQTGILILSQNISVSLNVNINSMRRYHWTLKYFLSSVTPCANLLHTWLYNYLTVFLKTGVGSRFWILASRGGKDETPRFILPFTFALPLYVLPSAIKFVAHAFRFINCRFLLHSSDVPWILFCQRRPASISRYESVCKIRYCKLTGLGTLSQNIPVYVFLLKFRPVKYARNKRNCAPVKDVFDYGTTAAKRRIVSGIHCCKLVFSTCLFLFRILEMGVWSAAF